MKKMSLFVSKKNIHLSIEKDAGNPFLVLMGAQSKKTIRDNWVSLKELCQEAIDEIDDLDLPETL